MRRKRHHRFSALQRERLAAMPRRRASESRRSAARQALARSFLVASVAVLGLGLSMVAHEVRFVAHARHAVGEVVEFRRETWTEEVVGRFVRERRECWRVVKATVAFAPDGGREVRFAAPVSKRGRVGVLYSPEHPERAQLDDPLVQWGPPALVMLTGLGLLAAWGRLRA